MNIIGLIFRIEILEKIVVQILNFFVSLVGNYGVAIILTTLLIKLITLPLTIKQEKSMLKMKELQPKIEELKKIYGDDKAKLSEMTTKLYQEENANPLGSCLPIVIQLPIFIALYYTFIGNSIPNDATFLWFNLKHPDSLFTVLNFNINLLPLISTLLMIVQQKMMASTQNSEDKTASTMMMTMPLITLFIFYKFPAGVNLYYTLNTLLTIMIQKLVSMKVRKNNE